MNRNQQKTNPDAHNARLTPIVDGWVRVNCRVSSTRARRQGSTRLEPSRSAHQATIPAATSTTPVPPDARVSKMTVARPAVLPSCRPAVLPSCRRAARRQGRRSWSLQRLPQRAEMDSTRQLMKADASPTSSVTPVLLSFVICGFWFITAQRHNGTTASTAPRHRRFGDPPRRRATTPHHRPPPPNRCPLLRMPPVWVAVAYHPRTPAPCLWSGRFPVGVDAEPARVTPFHSRAPPADSTIRRSPSKPGHPPACVHVCVGMMVSHQRPSPQSLRLGPHHP